MSTSTLCRAFHCVTMGWLVNPWIGIVQGLIEALHWASPHFWLTNPSVGLDFSNCLFCLFLRDDCFFPFFPWLPRLSKVLFDDVVWFSPGVLESPYHRFLLLRVRLLTGVLLSVCLYITNHNAHNPGVIQRSCI